MKPSGSGSYSFYYEAGAIWRCIATSSVVKLPPSPPWKMTDPRRGGGSQAYPEYAGRPLHAIYDEHPRGLDLPTRPGDTIIIAGGFIPHEVTPIVAGQRRGAVLLACYAMVDALLS